MEEEGGADASKTGGRKEKRKALKKLKRKKCRQQIAEVERIQQELRLVDPEEELRVLKEQQLEAEREELERKEFEENERLWLQKEQQAKEEFERKQQEKKNEPPPAEEEEDGDYIDGPSEIIWEGNEITIKKHRVKVIKEANKTKQKKDKPTEKDRPTHNPPPPRSAFQLSLNKVKLDHDPNYGTEQDKTHCPFHFKTGVCRFGTRCSRVHVYPEKSCTLLIKNMYTGPGLAWEHDEGLEYTDEEVAEQFEEFYEDVHSEFMKSGELVNFKVCRNSSPHLRGNVYIHYRSEDSAVAACLALTGRFYAGKQMFPEFVGVTKWKAALCGDYLKAHYGACSRGASCNFLHCFRNPGGEYDWADHDAPPPRTWQQKMAILFGHQSDYEHHTLSERDDPWKIDRDEHRERRRGRESHRDDHYQRRRGRESHQDDHYERKRGREIYEDEHRGRKSGRDKHKHGEDRDTSHGKENGKHSRKTSRKRSESDDEHEIRRYKRTTREEHSDDSSEHKRSKRSSHWDDQSDSSRRRHRHRSNSSSTTIIAKDRWQGGS